MSPRWVAVLAAAGLAACSGAADPSTRPPSVVLLVLDTVRADHLSCYGYEHPTTPAIDELAGSADRYARAYSTAPWTLPSHASMFTGYYPFQHGAQSRRSRTGRILDSQPLRARHRTLAEALAEAGYRTGAFVANAGYLSPRFKLDQGFETYELVPERAGELTRLASAWIDEQGDAPFFLFVNYMDAHRPYNVAPLPAERAAALPAPDPAEPIGLLDELCTQVLTEGRPAQPELVRRVVSQYDTGIAHLDLAVGRLAAHLVERGRFDDALFIVTSDHGEYFGEHDLVEHSKDVFEEALRVPLIVKRPGQGSGDVRGERITLADLPHLILAQLGLDGSTFPHAGAGTDVILAELRYTRSKDLNAAYGDRFRRERYVIYAGEDKFILSSDGAHELYDLARDPVEQENRAAAEPERAGDLGARLRAYMHAHPGPLEAIDPPDFDPGEEVREALDALGYLEGG